MSPPGCLEMSPEPGGWAAGRWFQWEIGVRTPVLGPENRDGRPCMGGRRELRGKGPGAGRRRTQERGGRTDGSAGRRTHRLTSAS